ncbi:hypothetical protein HK102_007237, partial [Quaeritorhiza haematococci]
MSAKLVTTALGALANAREREDNHTNWFVPHEYDDNYAFLKSQWIPVLVLLVLWALAILFRHVAEIRARQAGQLEEERRGLLAGEIRRPPPESTFTERFDKCARTFQTAFL